jgi:pseudouridine-5'-phosphate glycosidase
MFAEFFAFHPKIETALSAGEPVVALESTLIAHGLPWPLNLQTAKDAEAAVRTAGAVPATIAVLAGRPTIGLDDRQLEQLARSRNVRKASSRDLGAAIVQKADAATTVSATMRLAGKVGIRIFATGGIGGVHPASAGGAFDISCDLIELARTPVAVVCAGAKSILDLPATLEVLETHGVPVLGYQTDTFPAFYLQTSGLPVSARVDSPAEVAAVLRSHWRLAGAGAVLARPLPAELALAPDEFARALILAEQEARQQRVSGPALTPFLLARLAQHTGGLTLAANHALIVANAELAGLVACELPGEIA